MKKDYESKSQNINDYSVNCPFCQKAGEKILFNVKSSIPGYEDNEFTFARCKGCRLIFIKNAPENNEIYEINAESTGNNYFQNRIEKKRNKIRSSFIENVLNTGFLLEIETGTGELLSLLKERGFSVLGIDSAEENVNVGRQNLREIYNFTFENFFHYENEFNAVLFINVINYSSDPGLEIEKAIKLINQNGFIIIEEEIYGSKMDNFFKNNFAGYNPPKSKYYFNPRIIKKIMRAHGFVLKNKKKNYLSGFSNFIKSCSNFLKDKWKVKKAFLRFPLLLPLFVLSPLFNLYFYSYNYFKYGVFGNRFLGAFARSKH